MRCPAGGYPLPHVTWWRNRTKLSVIGERFEMTRDYSLMFRSVQLTDLGPYSCMVNNKVGHRPVTMEVTLKAVGPVRATTNEQAPFLQYIIDPATVPITERPSWPYRPSRPVQPPAPQPIPTRPRPQTSKYLVYGMYLLYLYRYYCLKLIGLWKIFVRISFI